MVFFDALRVKIRDEGHVRDKAVYLALAITSEGDKGRAGASIEQPEGASFWLKVMNELQDPRPAGYPHRGVEGLKGFLPYAIGTVFPRIAVRNTP